MNLENGNKRIIGIDPGTTVLGYCIVEQEAKTPILIASGIISLSKFTNHFKRLSIIYHRLDGIVAEFKPDGMSIEAPFFGKNVQSMLKLGRAQGVAITVALKHDIKVYEYAPRKIKQSITGNGNASKEQVAGMLNMLIKPMGKVKTLDESDAIAAAICHLNQSGKATDGSKKYNGWADFIQNNPGKLK